MTTIAHAPSIDALPSVLPIFPLAGVLLLPGGRLPLNIFEPRYLAMIESALAGDHLIGMIQPRDPLAEGDRIPIYETGCAGKITRFEATDDGRYLIMLAGLCRFRVIDELPLTESGYRRAHADFARFAGDVKPGEEAEIDHARLMRALRACCDDDDEDQPLEWRAIGRTSGPSLVISLSMMLPFSPSEKQGLLEARDTAERARMLVSLMEMMAAQGRAGTDDRTIQ